MAELRIHAGNFKTGSTSIQAVLFQQRHALMEQGVFVPETPHGATAHYSLAVPPGIEDVDAPMGWGDIAARSRDTGVVTTVVSAETFIKAKPGRLSKVLKKADMPSPDLYFYVRPVLDHLTSSYLQRLKKGRVHPSLREDVTRLVNSASGTFAVTLSRFRQIFGPDHVHVRDYDPARFPQGSLIRDVWGFMELPASLMELAAANENFANPSLCAAQQQLLVAFQRAATEVEAIDKTLVMRRASQTIIEASDTALDGTRRHKYRLPEALQQEVIDQTAGWQTRFAKRWLPGADMKRWRRPAPIARTLPDNLPVAAVADACRAATTGEDMPKQAGTLLNTYADWLDRAGPDGVREVWQEHER